ncbi:myotubularin-related protein 12 isoform X1 [Erpetoichthys calabaricus]|uniref:Myotubularin-related protein 12 n=1 Tax=Erpetoichthys calabaricus TaxID=27687 RepID=A0A8C4SQJ1_ERPCA|nr:myotubularin-related protein 12 isoform X1 [Erpetoichthys calabaricus]
MLSLGSGGGKAAKPSFISYVTPEEIKIKDGEISRKQKQPDLQPGEVIFCSAYPVLKCEGPQRGVYGTLCCTNFKISFISEESLSEETAPPLSNKLLGENDIALSCVDQIYGVRDEKKKLIIGGQVKNKYPPKLLIYCKDFRVFQFCLSYAKEEEAKKIFQGIVHHSLEPKSLKCAFAFSYCEEVLSPEVSKKIPATVMFESKDNWKLELNRTRSSCKVAHVNENYVVSERLPQYFAVPFAVSDEDIRKFKGQGVPLWCWSHSNGSALFKMSALPNVQDDGTSQVYQMFVDRMTNAVCQNQMYPVKTQDFSSGFLPLADLQQSYNKFKQFFLIDNTAEFWLSDVKWFSSIENTGWLEKIQECLNKATEIVLSLEEENSCVLMIEEDCSDLCCLFSSLVQVMLDPYYRTTPGFQSLIQKEWVVGGHSFLDRCNHLYQKEKESQSPLFLLFLECVWQLLQQHAPAFQFSETYLTVVSDSVHIPLFSTFLFNSQHQRDTATKLEYPDSQRHSLMIPSVWDWSLQFDWKVQALFTNPLYVEKPKQDKALRKPYRPKHQRQFSLPNSSSKPSPRKSFFKEETDNLKKMLSGMRIGKWINATEMQLSATRQFYESWQRKPLDYHGLILPCLDGPAIKIWLQRYLRWIPEAQIFGGGSVLTMKKVSDLAAEIEDLKNEMEKMAHNMHAGNTKKLFFSSFHAPTRLSSSFPFASLRTWSTRPVIPTSIVQSLGSVSNLAEKEDEDTEGVEVF